MRKNNSLKMGKVYKIAVVNGDGIGAEIVPAGVSVLKAVAEKHGFNLDLKEIPPNCSQTIEMITKSCCLNIWKII